MRKVALGVVRVEIWLLQGPLLHVQLGILCFLSFLGLFELLGLLLLDEDVGENAASDDE